MESKRLVFKFYKSYYEVAMELSDKDRLIFYDAIMKRQFFGIEPKLNGMVKFAYVSQKHNIDKQVKGWEDFTKNKLSDNQSDILPIIDPIIGCVIDPIIQLKDKEEEEEEDKEKYSVFSFEDFWKVYPNKTGKLAAENKYSKLSEIEMQMIKDTINDFIAYKPFATYNHPMPATYINNKRWNDEIPTNKLSAKQKDNVDILSLNFKELKDELLLNYTIQSDDLFYASYEMLIENYKSGKYPKKP